MNPRSTAKRFRSRVYTLFNVVLLACVALGGAHSVRAQVDISVHPTMTKGIATVPVTIVEFSDYQ